MQCMPLLKKKHSSSVLLDPIGPTLFSLSLPMIFGIISVLLINLVDTFWLGRLGTNELAAISFTFPVSFSLLSVMMGIGIGLSTTVSHAVGRKDQSEIQRLCSHGVLLGAVVVTILAAIGSLTMEPLFFSLGAEEAIMDDIKAYMSIWFAGVVLLSVPMVSNGAIRGMGDTTTPAIIMFVSASINVIADPIFIFGLGPIPAMGVQGAALATVVAWFFSFCLAIYVIRSRLKIFKTRVILNHHISQSWKKIAHIGFPASLSNLITPLSSALITALMAQFGTEAVAGFGVGSRIEPLALVAVMGLGSVLTPFMGQNWGAEQYVRARKALTIAMRFSLLFMGVVFVFLFWGRTPIAHLFSTEQPVIDIVLSYLTILPFSYGGHAITIIACSALNAVRRPMHSFSISFIRLFVLLIPLGYIGGELWQAKGVFIGMATANILSGGIAWSWARQIARRAADEEASA